MLSSTKMSWQLVTSLEQNGCTLEDRRLSRELLTTTRKEHDMNDYEINMDDEWEDDQVLWHFDEELSDESQDEDIAADLHAAGIDSDDCELWGFSLLDDEAAA